MSNDQTKQRTTAVVSVNWEGLKKFLGWKGSISDLKQVELDRQRERALAAAVGVPAAATAKR